MTGLTPYRALFFFGFLSLGVFAPFVALYLVARGVPEARVAAMLAAVPLARVFTPPLLGWLADRAGSPVPVLRVVSAAAVGGALAFLVAEGPAQLAAALLAQGVFHASIFPLADAAALAALAETPGDFGELRSYGSIGFLLGVGVGGYAWADAGIRDAPWGLAAATAVVAAGSFALPRGAPRPAAAARPRLRDVATLLRIPEIRAVLAVAFLHSSVLAGYDLYFSVHVESLGFSTRVTGACWAAGVFCEVFLLRRGAALLARFGPRKLVIAGCAAAVARWSAVAVIRDPAALIAVQGLHAFTFGGWFLGCVTAIEAAAPPRLRASAQGLFYSVLFGLAVAVGAYVGGKVAAAAGTAALFRWMGLAAVAPLVLAGLWLPHGTVPPRPGPRPDPGRSQEGAHG